MKWPELRAGLVAIAIGFGLIDGCPLPPRDATPEWERSFVEPIRSVRDVALAPVAWLEPTLRVSQRWALWQAPGEARFRMVIEGEAADRSWSILYRAADPEHAEDAATIESARVWGAWNPTDRPPDQYRGFASWILGRVLARHPELGAARVRMERIAIEPGGWRPTGDFVFAVVRTR